MRTVIYYRSVFKGTEMYARWLAEELKADLIKFNSTKLGVFDEYDRIIVMSAVYSGWMPLAGFINHNWERMQGKEVIAIACGFVSGYSPLTEVFQMQIRQDIMNEIKFFTLQGAIPFARGKLQEKHIKKENIDKLLIELNNEGNANQKLNLTF